FSTFLLDGAFIDIGRIGFGRDAGIGKQTFARRAGRGEDQHAHVSSPRARASNRRIAAAVSSIERRLTSITGQLRSVKRRRAVVTSSLTLSRSVYSLRSCWCSDARRWVRTWISRSGSLVRPTINGRVSSNTSSGTGTPGTIGTFAALIPRLAR